MIIKNILNKFYVHPLFLLLAISAVLTGLFKDFLFYFFLIIVHELGHFLTAYFLKWNIDKIYLYPYGGYSKFNEDINKPLKEELLILIMGPLVQIIFYFLLSHFLSDKSLLLFTSYHYSLLIFNLLPVYPLDGGKLVNLLLSYKYSYLKSYNLTMYISYFVWLVLTFIIIRYVLVINLVLMLLLLLTKMIESAKKRKYYYNKFLLERYINNYKFNKVKTVNHLEDMMRDRRHVIRANNNYYTEKQILRKSLEKMKQGIDF